MLATQGIIELLRILSICSRVSCYKEIFHEVNTFPIYLQNKISKFLQENGFVPTKIKAKFKNIKKKKKERKPHQAVSHMVVKIKFFFYLSLTTMLEILTLSLMPQK